jgi:hypothetical protein
MATKLNKISAWIQIFFILGLIAFSTFCLFTGRFEQAIAPFPILAIYWVFVASRRTQISSFEDEDTDEDKKKNP